VKVGLLGGSFDPVHKGHIKLAQAARKQLHLGKIFLVLTPRSPFKRNQSMTPVSQRLRWLRASLKGKKGIKIGTWELKKKGPVYTVDTLRRYTQLHPRDQIFFVMGSDSWKTFGRWKNPDSISQLATLVVGKRPGAVKIKIPAKLKNSVRVLSGIFPQISSSDIRTALKNRRKISKSLLPSAVWNDLVHGR
jgi:nicotinate-nucleotide adenylyltransferase